MSSQFKRLLRSEKKGAAAPPPEVPVYTDASVCRVLRIRRRVLAEARTAAARGRDWGAVGDEVGMTMRWIRDYAATNHLAIAGPLERVTGRFVSVRLVGTTPNRSLVQVELEATGKREFARTRNIVEHPIHYREAFTCIRVDAARDGHLEWIATPNEARY